MINASRLLAALGLCAAAFPVHAQDVVVMRRSVAAPTLRTDRSTAPSDTRGVWVPGEWQWVTSETCSRSEPRTRAVSCRANGKDVDPSRCVDTKPDTTETAPRYDGCVIDWVQGQWGEYSSTCSQSATRTRTVTCERFGGRITGDLRPEAECVKAKPDTQDKPTSITTGCVTYRWSAVEGACTSVLRRGRSVTCQKIQGSIVETVSDSMCNQAERPTDYVTDDACAPKSASCSIRTGYMISEFVTNPGKSDRLDLDIGGKTAEQMRAETAKFCEGHAYATTCQGVVAPARPYILVLYAGDNIGKYATQEQVYGSKPFLNVFAGECSPVF
jgi:hypothetical protein